MVAILQAYALGTMDISGRRFTFFPVDSSAYRFCTDDAPELTEAVTPAATNLLLKDDEYKIVDLPANTQFIFFGIPYDQVYVGSNGYITFGSGDTSFRSFEDNLVLGFVNDDVKDEVALLVSALEERCLKSQLFPDLRFPSDNAGDPGKPFPKAPHFNAVQGPQSEYS